MKTYTAKFRTDAEWAEEEFKAATPEEALALARAFYDEHDEELMFQEYGGGMPVNEIEVCGEDGTAIWRGEDLRLQLAARSLLEACKAAIERLEMNNCEGGEQEFIDQLHAAILEAT